MATKKTTEEKSGFMGGIDFLRESVTLGIGGVLQSVFGVIEHGTLTLLKKSLRLCVLVFFSVLAGVFLLVGIARVLDAVYRVPGVGEIVVGVLIFGGVLLVYMFEHANQSK